MSALQLNLDPSLARSAVRTAQAHSLTLENFEGRQKRITTGLEHDVHVVKLDPSIVSRLPKFLRFS